MLSFTFHALGKSKRISAFLKRKVIKAINHIALFRNTAKKKKKKWSVLQLRACGRARGAE